MTSAGRQAESTSEKRMYFKLQATQIIKQFIEDISIAGVFHLKIQIIALGKKKQKT
jgi:hypothetical protein